MKDNTSEKILEIRVKYDDAIRKIAEYRTQLDILRKVEQTLKEDLKKGRMSREEYNIKLTENRVATQQYTDAIRVLNKQIQNERKEQTEMEGSLVRLRAELSNLTAAYDRLSRVEREGGEGKELQDKINAITDELKGAEEETQRFYRNVGNYKDAILQATEAQVPFVSILRSGVSVLRGTKEFVGGLKDELVKITVQYKAGTVTANMFSGAQKTAAITSNLLSAALKVLKLALISTGIGATVVLLGSLVAWLANNLISRYCPLCHIIKQFISFTSKFYLPKKICQFLSANINAFLLKFIFHIVCFCSRISTLFQAFCSIICNELQSFNLRATCRTLHIKHCFRFL